MAQEVEAKFRLAGLPQIDEGNKGKEIKQGYLDFKNDDMIKIEVENLFGDIDLSGIKEARIRAKGSGENAKYFFTLKSDGTLLRDEFEEGIDSDKFEQLWPRASLGRVSKIRREIDLGDGLTAEVDEYKDNLEGLYTLEVEFDPEVTPLLTVQAKVTSFDPSAEDVTELKSYKNREMALKRNLGELELAVQREKEQKMTENRLPIR